MSAHEANKDCCTCKYDLHKLMEDNARLPKEVNKYMKIIGERDREISCMVTKYEEEKKSQEIAQKELLSEKDGEINKLKGRLLYLEDKVDSMMLMPITEAMSSEETVAHLDKIAELSIALKENEDLKVENEKLKDRLTSMVTSAT